LFQRLVVIGIFVILIYSRCREKKDAAPSGQADLDTDDVALLVAFEAMDEEGPSRPTSPHRPLLNNIPRADVIFRVYAIMLRTHLPQHIHGYCGHIIYLQTSSFLENCILTH
jgi:hypothetical protein